MCSSCIRIEIIHMCFVVAAAEVKSFGVKGKNRSYISHLKSQESAKEGRISFERQSSATIDV